jgi:hypothetical protein
LHFLNLLIRNPCVYLCRLRAPIAALISCV